MLLIWKVLGPALGSQQHQAMPQAWARTAGKLPRGEEPEDVGEK